MQKSQIFAKKYFIYKIFLFYFGQSLQVWAKTQILQIYNLIYSFVHFWTFYVSSARDNGRRRRSVWSGCLVSRPFRPKKSEITDTRVNDETFTRLWGNRPLIKPLRGSHRRGAAYPVRLIIIKGAHIRSLWAFCATGTSLGAKDAQIGLRPRVLRGHLKIN